MVLKRFELSVRLDLALLRLVSRAVSGEKLALTDEYVAAIAGVRSGKTKSKRSSSKSLMVYYDLMIGAYLVASGALIAIGLLAVLYLDAPTSGLVAVIASLLLGPVAAQALGHGILAPVAHRGGNSGLPWGVNSLESAVLFLALSVSFSVAFLVLLF